MEWVVESKLLDFNIDKSCYLVFGKKAAKKALLNELEKNPLTLCKKNMKCVSEDKYLGDIISGNGLAESVKATVNKRRGQVLRNIIEIRAVLEDCRSNSLGGVMLGIELWVYG